MAFKMKKFSGFGTPMKKNIDPSKPMVNKPRAKKDKEKTKIQDYQDYQDYEDYQK